jgi:hypothetical protein
MEALRVECSPLVGDLLRLAWATAGLPPGSLILCPTPVAAVPAFVHLPAGGVAALAGLGVDTEALRAQARVIDQLVLLDARGAALLCTATALPETAHDALWLPWSMLQETVTRAAAHLPPARHETPSPSGPAWRSAACPGILMTTRRGRLKRPQVQLLWAAANAHVGMVQVAEEEILLYAVPRDGGPASHRLCQGRLADLAPLEPHIAELGAARSEEWFGLTHVGHRPTWADGTLRWGSAALRLHPLTGQHIGFWSIQSLRLAEELVQEGALSAAFVEQMDRRLQRTYRAHRRTLAFHLRPTLLWQAALRPYSFLLSHCGPLRRRAVARTSLAALA